MIPWVGLAGSALAGIVVLMLVKRLSDSREAVTPCVPDRCSYRPCQPHGIGDRAGNRTRASPTIRDPALSVALLDLYHFKDFIDRHGHQAGDQYAPCGKKPFGFALAAVKNGFQLIEIVARVTSPSGGRFSANRAASGGAAASLQRLQSPPRQGSTVSPPD